MEISLPSFLLKFTRRQWAAVSVVQIIFSLLFFYADSRVTAADIQLHSANDCDKFERVRDDISSAC